MIELEGYCGDVLKSAQVKSSEAGGRNNRQKQHGHVTESSSFLPNSIPLEAILKGNEWSHQGHQ